MKGSSSEGQSCMDLCFDVDIKSVFWRGCTNRRCAQMVLYGSRRSLNGTQQLHLVDVSASQKTHDEY